MGRPGPLTREVRRLRMAPSFILRPWDVKAIGQKCLAIILELLGLGMGGMVTGIHHSGVECVHKDVVRRETNAPVGEAEVYLRTSGDTVKTCTCGYFDRSKEFDYLFPG